MINIYGYFQELAKQLENKVESINLENIVAEVWERNRYAPTIVKRGRYAPTIFSTDYYNLHIEWKIHKLIPYKLTIRNIHTKDIDDVFISKVVKLFNSKLDEFSDNTITFPSKSEYYYSELEK